MYRKIESMNSSLKIGLVGMGVYALLMIIAMFNYPNYDQFNQTLSKLGARWPSSLYFSLGLIVGAITTVWILILLKDDVIALFPNKKWQFRAIGILFAVLIIFMLGIVIFPSIGVTSDIHDVIAVSLFIIMAIITTWVSIIAGSSLPKWNRVISNLGYSCSISVILMGLLLIYWEFGALMQRITILEFNIWIILIAHEFKRYAANNQ
jgi:hypothetical protein